MNFTYEKVHIGGQSGIRILSCDDLQKKLRIPEAIDGLRVLSIGKQAFNEHNSGLEEVVLPDGLAELQSFAFSFCSGLKKLILSDGIRLFHDGAVRTCFALRDIELKMSSHDYTLARRLLGDSDRRLRITFRLPGHDIRLVFPEYYSNSIEDTKSQAFHIRIDGTGFSYRECVCTGGIRLREYDGLFRRTLSSDEPAVPLEIAAARLMYPQGLSEAAKEVYCTYLKEHMDEALKLSFLPENDGWPEMLLTEALLSREDIDPALRLASFYRKTEFSGELLEYRRRNFQDRKGAVLTLSDEW